MASIQIKAILHESLTLTRGTKWPLFICFLGILAAQIIATIIMSLLMSFLFGVSYLDIALNPNAATQSASLFSLGFSVFIFPFFFASFLAGMVMIGLNAARHKAIPNKIGFMYFHKTISIAMINILISLSIIVVSMLISYCAEFIIPYTATVASIYFVIATIVIVIFLASLVLGSLLQLSLLLILDKNMNPFSAYVQSMRIILPHFWHATLLFIICVVINIVAILTIIGPLWTIPMMLNAIGIVYRELAPST